MAEDYRLDTEMYRLTAGDRWLLRAVEGAGVFELRFRRDEIAAAIRHESATPQERLRAWLDEGRRAARRTQFGARTGSRA